MKTTRTCKIKEGKSKREKKGGKMRKKGSESEPKRKVGREKKRNMKWINSLGCSGERGMEEERTRRRT